MPERLTYGSYLHIDELLSLQRPQSDPPHHDELLFIIIHQVYELWFRQLLHEIEAAMRNLAADDLLKAGKNFRRIDAIQRLIETQIDVLETMTPQEFNAFRDRLNPRAAFNRRSSGRSNSCVARARPATCAFSNRRAPNVLGSNGAWRSRRSTGRSKRSWWRRGFAVDPSDALLATYKTIYENSDNFYDLYMLLEEFIEFDERFLLWRGRHIRMVERMIGMKPGTGGSLGVEYLAKTLDKKFFPELWTVRTLLGSDQYG